MCVYDGIVNTKHVGRFCDVRWISTYDFFVLCDKRWLGDVQEILVFVIKEKTNRT